MNAARPRVPSLPPGGRSARAWLERGASVRPISRGSRAWLLLQLWSCLGVALLVLTAWAGVTRAAQGSEGATVTAIAVASGDTASDHSHGQWGLRSDRHQRPTAHEQAALEAETDREDGSSDAAATTAAALPSFASIRAFRLPPRARVDAGRVVVRTALARGPPVAG